MNLRSEPLTWNSDKIQSHHRERLAVVYVRQSTLQQVADHQESTRLQYGLVGRAEALGWESGRILIIDEDQGKSGSSAEGRLGFQRLVSEVGLNHVGLILGIEMSRLARSSADWHQLLEICAWFRTLIADLDGVYEPSNYNDRLLLGLKGTMSEAELHILKQRMVQGKHNKAKRGELSFIVPTGYVRALSGEVRLDPDEQVQHVVKLIFRKFEELGTLNAMLRYLVAHQIQLGVRVKFGVNKGELEWRRPNRATLQNLLKNPSYAGAYAYGRKQVDLRKKKAGRPHTGQVVKPPEEWLALIKDRHPAYISWEQYERNLAQLKSNQKRADERGHAGKGMSLLSGLLVCGRCGSRMTVQYHDKRRHRYICCNEQANYGGKLCQGLSGACLDECIAAQLLQALQPASLELSLAAVEHIENDRIELDRLWKQRLERAQFEVDRASRHYHLIEPENRLVARELAKEWEVKLQGQQELQEDYERFCCEQPIQLSNEEKKAILELAEHLPLLWSAPTTTQSQRKEIIRQVIDTITVTVQGESEQVQIKVNWVGGYSCETQISRPVAKWTQLSYYSQLCQRLAQLVTENLSTREMIDCLHQEGFRPPKRCQTFNPEMLRALMRQLGLRPQQSSSNSGQALPEDEWWLPELAASLKMPATTLYSWVKRGWVKARQQPDPPRHWVIWADETELERLRQHRKQPSGAVLRQRWKGETPEIAIPPQ